MGDWYTPFILGLIVGGILMMAWDELAGWRNGR